MTVNRGLIAEFYGELGERSREALDAAARKVAEARKNGGRVAAATGSGPNLHEGVTTLIAGLISKEIIDGVTTGSAAASHEMGWTLGRVKMCGAAQLWLSLDKMPCGGVLEFTDMTDGEPDALSRAIALGRELLAKRHSADWHMVMKAAAGWGCDERTMLGAEAERGVPAPVALPQMAGGGYVGLSVGGSIPVAWRSRRIADMLGGADVIIESAAALTQEIHDGPFETYAGRGTLPRRQGRRAYILQGKTPVRFDLNENICLAQDLQRSSAVIQKAVGKGLQDTKISFRMEMSAFVRRNGSLPAIGDIGMICPAFALRIAGALGIELFFMSCKQETDDGKVMRKRIMKNVRSLDRENMLRKFHERKAVRCNDAA